MRRIVAASISVHDLQPHFKWPQIAASSCFVAGTLRVPSADPKPGTRPVAIKIPYCGPQSVHPATRQNDTPVLAAASRRALCN